LIKFERTRIRIGKIITIILFICPGKTDSSPRAGSDVKGLLPQLLQPFPNTAVMFPDTLHLFAAEIGAFGAGGVSLFQGALPDCADAAVTEYFFPIGLLTTEAVDGFPVYFRFEHGGPLRRRLLPQIIVIFLCCFVGIAVGTDKPAFGDYFIHLLHSLFFL
jgi:hypothetical protein